VRTFNASPGFESRLVESTGNSPLLIDLELEIHDPSMPYVALVQAGDQVDARCEITGALTSPISE
jgi:hypothetical protein